MVFLFDCIRFLSYLESGGPDRGLWLIWPICKGPGSATLIGCVEVDCICKFPNWLGASW